MDIRHVLTLSNRLDELPRLAEFVEAFGAASGLAPADVYKLNLVLDELVTNIVSYAYRDDGAHAVEVCLAVTGDRLCAVLSDEGVAFDPLREAPEPPLEGELADRPIGGLGLHLVRSLMDEVNYRRVDGHNELTLVKRLSPHG